MHHVIIKLFELLFGKDTVQTIIGWVMIVFGLIIGVILGFSFLFDIGDQPREHGLIALGCGLVVLLGIWMVLVGFR